MRWICVDWQPCLESSIPCWIASMARIPRHWTCLDFHGICTAAESAAKRNQLVWRRAIVACLYLLMRRPGATWRKWRSGGENMRRPP